MRPQPLYARARDVDLAGTLWQPDDGPRGLIIMHPGSGPSDRDNDVLFPPIRAALLEMGVAVCSFDKRGVGESSGNWLDADITQQAGDLAAGLGVAQDVVGTVPTGLFGHSQGGWVVLEAAATVGAEFLIANSGPSVTPREQETFSTEQTLRLRGWNDRDICIGVDTFTRVMELLSYPFADAWPQVRALPLLDELVAAGVFIPADPPLWAFAARIMPHDPRAALRALEVPLLVVLGGDDDVVPVDACAAAYRELVRGDLLDLRILAGGDHRLQHDDRFVDGYLTALTAFVADQLS